MGQHVDILPGFMAEDLSLPNDYDGAVVATLVSKKAAGSTNAVLYVHGYCDYFFQNELADFYVNRGINFYAVDLRKYGRSLRTGAKFNYCRDMKEYYGELDMAIDLIRTRDGNTKLLLNGHSTGGLLATVYAHDSRTRGTIDALFLNSPFYDFNDVWTQELLAKYLIATVGLVTPDLIIPSSGLPLYGESVALKYGRGGTATFNEDWKPVHANPIVRAGWVRAIRMAQGRVHAGLAINVPTLLMRSDKSGGGAAYNPSYDNSDCVLDVAEISLYGGRIMDKTKPALLKEFAIQDGLHDLILSRSEPRADTYSKLVTWLETNFV